MGGAYVWWWMMKGWIEKAFIERLQREDNVTLEPYTNSVVLRLDQLPDDQDNSTDSFMVNIYESTNKRNYFIYNVPFLLFCMLFYDDQW